MNTQLQLHDTLLDPALRTRPAQWTDMAAIAQLVLDVCTADGDPTVATSEEELRQFWNSPDVQLETDAWIVETGDGRLVGYQEFYNRHAHASLHGDGYVDPAFHGQGIGTALLRWLEERARQEMERAAPDLRVYIRNGMSTGDASARQLHEHEGYRPIRYFWHMEIDLDAPPRTPDWLAGIELRPFVLEQHNLAVFEVHEEAFHDHWGHMPETFEHWQHHVSGREDLDPTLWFVAWEGDQIAGYALCRYRMGIGWVGSLGVRRPWRRRGLGEALLLHAFAEFYRRGIQTVGLGVDAESPTGATRLYQKAGMHVAAEYVTYEKELRPGRDPGEQSEEQDEN